MNFKNFLQIKMSILICLFKDWPSLIEKVTKENLFARSKNSSWFLLLLHFDTKAADSRILNQGKGFPALERAVLVIICVTKVRFYNTTLTRRRIAGRCNNSSAACISVQGCKMYFCMSVFLYFRAGL